MCDLGKKDYINTEKPELDQVQETRWYKRIDILALLFSLVSITVSCVALFQSQVSNDFSEQSVRPRLKIDDFLASCTEDEIIIKYSLFNMGNSPAVLDKLQVTLVTIDNDKVKHIVDDDNKNLIINPSDRNQEYYDGEIREQRYLELPKSNIRIDLAQTDPSGFRFEIDYHIRGKAKYQFSEAQTSSDIKWHSNCAKRRS